MGNPPPEGECELSDGFRKFIWRESTQDFYFEFQGSLGSGQDPLNARVWRAIQYRPVGSNEPWEVVLSSFKKSISQRKIRVRTRSKENLNYRKELIDEHCQEMGLIVRPIINMCVFSPPLIITGEQIDEMFDILEEGIKRTAKDLGVEPGK